MKIIAHRGVTSSAPQNTLAAFLDAAHQGYGVECDIRLTRDGVPVIIHDALIETREGRRRVSDLDLSQLEGILLEEQHPIPKLESVIKHVLPETFVDFNIKEDAAVGPSLALLRAAHAPHGMVLTAHSVDAVRQLKNNFSQSGFVHSWLLVAVLGALRSHTKIIVCRGWPINRWFFRLLTRFGWEIYVWGKSLDGAQMRTAGVSCLIKDI